MLIVFNKENLFFGTFVEKNIKKGWVLTFPRHKQRHYNVVSDSLQWGVGKEFFYEHLFWSLFYL